MFGKKEREYASCGFMDFEALADFAEELSFDELLSVNGGCGGGCGGGGGGSYSPSYSPSRPSSGSGNSSSSGCGGAGTSSSSSSSSGCGGTSNSINYHWTNPKSWDIKYDSSNKAIRVNNTDPETLKMALENPYGMAVQLVSDYKKETGSDFSVTVENLAAEIYIHAAAYKNLGSKSEYINEHASWADCGVKDKERFIYEIYSKLM